MKESPKRIELLSDAVMAIIITVMVLEIKLPDSLAPHHLLELGKDIFIFFASFIIVGSFWDKHYQLFEHLETTNNVLIWRNFIFLFFLTLIPLFTKWVMLEPDASIPIALYGLLYFCTNICFNMLMSCVIPLSNEQVREIMAARQNYERRPIFVMLFFGVAFITAMAFFFPKTSVVLFIGFPILTTLTNLFGFLSRDKWHHKKRALLRKHIPARSGKLLEEH